MSPETILNAPELIVRKNIVIQAPVAHVFSVFVDRHNAWWPRSHHIGKSESFTVRLEPGAGGRWYEAGADGSACDWGRVLVWEPPHRLVLRWDINAQWQHDPEIANEVEIRFIPEGPEVTRVELEHRRIERYGDKAETMRTAFDSPGGWSGVLAEFAKAAEPKAA